MYTIKYCIDKKSDQYRIEAGNIEQLKQHNTTDTPRLDRRCDYGRLLLADLVKFANTSTSLGYQLGSVNYFGCIYFSVKKKVFV